MKVFGVVMALLLVLSFAATFSISSTVSAKTQKWSQIAIPGTNDMQLAPGTDIGAIAVSPDGATLFAAVYNVSTGPGLPHIGNWSVYKSVDDGYTWKDTGLRERTLDPDRNPATADSDNTDIVAIDISPDWENDNRVYVATQWNVYSSNDGGKTFSTKYAITDSDGNAIDLIICMDVSLDDNGDVTVAIGTSESAPGTGTADVYILGENGWDVQRIELGFASSLSVFKPANIWAVSFSPNYAEDGVVFAVVSDAFSTYLCAESDITVNNWGSYIQNAPFTNKTLGDILASHACMAFAEDYNSVPAVFVGLTGIAGPLSSPAGDAFRVDLVSGIISTSAASDLNIRGLDTWTDVYSIAVSGPQQSAFILVGLSGVSPFGPSGTWMGQVHYSNNGGESWLQCFKPAAGMSGYTVAPIVVMAPDFDIADENAKAYCGNGYIIGSHANTVMFSSFSVSTTQGTTWDGRGLLDHTINDTLGDRINDIQPSPDYDNDSTLFMVTTDHGYIPPPFGMPTGDFGLLWETQDSGSHWELILSMTLAMPLPGMTIDSVRIPATYPQDPEIFVTGPTTAGLPPATTKVPNALIARSTDEGNLFASTLNAPWSGGVPLVVNSWVVMDDKTLVVSNGSNIYKTTDFGAHWKLPTAADIDIATGEKIIDMQRYKDTGTLLVGTDRGNMYICNDWENDFSFTQVGKPDPTRSHLVDSVHVAFDTNFDENGFVYAGVTSTEPKNEGIWRVDANSDDIWDQIDQNYGYDCGNVSAIRSDGNGILWALTAHNVSRSVNPNEPLYDEVRFETVAADDGLASKLTGNLVTAPTQTYVFAVGGNTSAPTELWTYTDTLIKATLISPADGATAAGTIIEGNTKAHVTLMWEDMPEADWYDYQVAYDPDFESPIYDCYPIDSLDGPWGLTEGSQASVELFLGEKYYWRVRVTESNPVYSQWSDTWSFTTPLGPASVKPVCLSPTEGLTGVSLTPPLQWSSAVEATGFELMVAAGCDWSNARINLTGSSALGAETAYQVTAADGLQEGTNYCWKVRATNEDTATNSPWSDTGTFTTLVVTVVEAEGTPMWVWVVIALSAVLLVGVVVLIIRTRRPV